MKPHTGTSVTISDACGRLASLRGAPQEHGDRKRDNMDSINIVLSTNVRALAVEARGSTNPA
jgi:hypothetical protein